MNYQSFISADSHSLTVVFFFKFQVLLHPPWRKMSNIVRKQNPNMITTFDKEEKHLNHWHEQLMYRQICLLIEESLKVLNLQDFLFIVFTWPSFNIPVYRSLRRIGQQPTIKRRLFIGV